MKTIQLVLLLFISSIAFGQDLEKKDFKSSTNKYYIGANVSPIFVAMLNAQNYQPEWKLGYKQRLGNQNHYLRISYSYMNNSIYTNDLWSFRGVDLTSTYAINDSMDWRTGYFKNVNNNQNLKIGYEYQFKIGEKRSASINLGADMILGFLGGKLFFANDTTTYRTETVDGYVFRNQVVTIIDHDLVQRAKVYYGFSPVIAVGIPLKKRFDLTMEMAVDCAFKTGDFNTRLMEFSLNYRPSVQLSYRFDEKVSARDKAQEKR
jgi:hypothetical protein